LCEQKNLQVIDRDSNIWQCITCGYVFDNPRPTPEEIAAYYSTPRKYDAWLEKEAERDLLWRRRLKKVERHKKMGTLLDIGTGTGQFLNIARGAFTSVYGTEISESAVTIAKEKYGLDIVRSQIVAVDFKETTFDNITLFHVLEHVHDPLAVLEKCRALLCSGGRLFIAVPNELGSLRNMVRKVLNRLGLKKIRYHGKLGLPEIKLDGSLDEIHLSHFTPQVLLHFLERQGFTVMENGLDPYYAEKGLRLLFNNIYYMCLSAVAKLSSMNLYDTIWIVAKKN